MKFSLIPYRVLSLLFLLLFCTGNALAKECRNYSFLNKSNSKLTEFIAVDELKEDEYFKGLAELKPDTVDVTLTNFAIWVDPKNAGKWKKEIDEANNSQKKALAKLKNTAERLALEKAIQKANDGLEASITNPQIDELVTQTLPKLKELLSNGEGPLVTDAKRERRGGDEEGKGSQTNKPQCIVATYKFRFDRKTLEQEIQPSPVVISIPSPTLDPADISSDDTYVVRYEEHVVVLGGGDLVPKEDAEWHVHANQAISKLSKGAFGEAIKEANKDIHPPRTPEEIQAIIDNIGDLRRYTQKYAIKYSAIAGHGKESKLVLTVYFYFNRLEIKDLVQPAERSQTVKIDLGSVLGTDIPSGDDSTYVAVFRDHDEDVESDVQDKDSARKKAVRLGVEKLKQLAFEQAAKDLRGSLPQMEDDEYERAVEKANRNYVDFIKDYKWIDDPKTVARSGNTTAPEGVRLNIYFVVDLDALKKALLSGSLMAEVVKLKTYVELYWNIPPTELEDAGYDPAFLEEMTATVIQNVEDQFSRTGYRILEFEKIQGDLEALMLEAKTKGLDDDAGAKDEYSRLMLNLELRNLSQSKFKAGKRLLSENSDLLIGVAINAIELSQDFKKVTVRLTVDATLFERESTEEWVKLASSDSHRTIPFRGDLSPIIEVGKLLSGTVVTDLLPKIRQKLVKRAATEDIVLKGEQTYIVAFPGTSNKVFKGIKKLIKEESEWERKKASTKKRELSYLYTGGIENFVEELEELLEDNDYEIRSASHKTGDNRVTIEFEELEVEEIFALVFPEVSKKQFKGIKRLIKELDLDRKSASQKKRELRYAYDGGIEELVEELEDLFEDSDFGEVDIEYETGDTRIVVNLMESKRQQLVISGLSAERYNYKKVLYHEAVTEQEDVTDVVYEYLAGGDDRTGRLIFEFGYTGDLAKLEASVWRILAIEGEVRNIIKRQLIP